MIYLLIFGILILLMVNLIFSKGDLFSPASMLCSVYLFCVVMALFNYEVWELDDFSLETVELILTSLCVFSFVGILISNLFFKTQKPKREIYSFEKCKARIIKVNSGALYISICFELIVIILCVVNVIKIGGTQSGWAYILNNYKNLTNNGKAALPDYLDTLIKVVTCLGYIFLFIFINNIVFSNKFKGNIRFSIPVLLHITRSLLTGSRYNMICIFIAGVYALYILYQQKNGWKKRIKGKYLVYGAICIIIIFVLFIALKRVAGRTDDIDPFYYITMYTSGSIKLLDEYIKNPIESSAIWGKETFSGLNIFLANRGIGTVYDINLEFRFINGVNIGNVYGAIRRYYQDFGLAGCLFLVGLSSLIWNLLYCKLKYSMKNHNFLLIVFMFMAHALVIFPIDDKFYNIIFTPSFILHWVFMYFLYLVIIRKRLFFI